MFSFGILSAIALGCTKLNYGPEHFTSHKTTTNSTIVNEKVLEKVGLEYYWEPINLKLSDGERIVKMYCLGENLYFLSNQNYLHCVNAAKGMQTWAYKVTKKTETIYAPIHVENMRMPEEIIVEGADKYEFKNCKPFDAVVINTETKVVVLDRNTGKAIRDFRLTDQASCQGACDGPRFYYGNFHNYFNCSLLASTKPIWDKRVGDKPIRTPLRKLFNLIYAGTVDGKMLAFGSDDAEDLRWENQLEGQVLQPFTADLRGIFVGCDNGHLYGLNRSSGENIWDPVDLESNPNMPTQLSANSVFQHTPKGLFAINLLDGKIRWQNKNANRVITVIKNQLYLLDKNNTLLVVDEITGQEKSTLPMTGADFISTSIRHDAIFYATKTGHVFCVRAKGAPLVTKDSYRMLK